jgi:glycosyltransferase involved in cell wall biosynthesis
MKISIITISNNHAKYIEDCINSVLNQKYKNIEHIIIDNKSDDGTLDILKRIKKKDKRFKFVSEKDSGPASALNKGFNLADGDIFYFLNSDDYLLKDSLDKIHNFFINNTEIDLLLSGGHLVDEKGNLIKKLYSSKQNIYLFLRGINEFFQQGMFFKKSLYLKTNGFNELNHVSWDGELFFDFLKIKASYKRIFAETAAFRVQKNSITQKKEYILDLQKQLNKLFLDYYKINNYPIMYKILHIFKYIYDPLLALMKLKNQLKIYN